MQLYQLLIGSKKSSPKEVNADTTKNEPDSNDVDIGPEIRPLLFYRYLLRKFVSRCCYPMLSRSSKMSYVSSRYLYRRLAESEYI